MVNRCLETFKLHCSMLPQSCMFALQVPNSMLRPQSDDASAVHSLQREVAKFMFEMLPSNVDKMSSDLVATLSVGFDAAQMPSEQALSDAIKHLLCQRMEVAVRLLGAIISASSADSASDTQALPRRMVVQIISKLLTTHVASGFISTLQQILLLAPQAVSALDTAGITALIELLKSVSCTQPDALQVYSASGFVVEVLEFLWCNSTVNARLRPFAITMMLCHTWCSFSSDLCLSSC